MLMHSFLTRKDGHPLVFKRQFQISTWILCGIATLFLASRFAIRMHAKGRLMINDYFLVLALPTLYIGVGLLQSTVHVLYPLMDQRMSGAPYGKLVTSGTSRRFTAAIEMLWISIFSVKFCFLAQFKFHKPPYAYVSVHLTRYYWTVISLCTIGSLYAIIQPIVLCSGAGKTNHTP
ncbi:hypothetical protein K491DRAFT_434356 [Lophiostoma macrostomum CBS 122681]|uniref:Uncharacterized protein n=1 Tax=Lophiostoma macrostomum CBS 122681 TaxID=1314788 RepID=A0A6A6T7J4_9PLEO|nr:hypothetical protein K491DRAFT_434356 [Lophiostoma macrostomum CBS 122681]